MMNSPSGEVIKIKEEFVLQNEAQEYEYCTEDTAVLLMPEIKTEPLEQQIQPALKRRNSCTELTGAASLKMAKVMPQTTPSLALKVKCLCRLGGQSMERETAVTLAERRAEMQSFFEQMFQAARGLPAQRQRAVKQELLKAICEAEDYAEAGKCCERCCV